MVFTDLSRRPRDTWATWRHVPAYRLYTEEYGATSRILAPGRITQTAAMEGKEGHAATLYG